jgi:urea transport system substrate-binding protein
MPFEIQRRNFLRLGGGVGLAAAFGPTLAACSSSSGSANADELRIGFLTAFTGLETILGETQFNCYKLAADEINAAGGVAGRKIVTIKEDDATDSQKTIDKANKLALQDQVVAVIGLITSLEKEAALSVLPKQKTPLFYTTYYEGSYLNAKSCDPNYVGMGQVPNQQIDPLVPWLSENVGKTYYIVGSDYIWPRATSERLRQLVDGAGGTIVGEQYFPFGTTDFSKVFRDLQTKKPDICWAPLAGADFMTFLNQYDQFSAKPQLVSIGMDDVFARENPGVGTGSIASQSYFMSIDTPANKKFLKSYQRAYGAGKPVNAIGEAAYNSLWLMKAAIEKAKGSVDPADWVPALSQVSFEAPSGLVRIDRATQHAITEAHIGEVEKDGSIKVLSSMDAITPVVTGCSLA